MITLHQLSPPPSYIDRRHRATLYWQDDDGEFPCPRHGEDCAHAASDRHACIEHETDIGVIYCECDCDGPYHYLDYEDASENICPMCERGDCPRRPE